MDPRQARPAQHPPQAGCQRALAAVVDDDSAVVVDAPAAGVPLQGGNIRQWKATGRGPCLASGLDVDVDVDGARQTIGRFQRFRSRSSGVESHIEQDQLWGVCQPALKGSDLYERR
jgi:hypothetical protein